MVESYAELECAMSHLDGEQVGTLSERQIEVLEIYNRLHGENSHKMSQIPVFKMRRG